MTSWRKVGMSAHCSEASTVYSPRGMPQPNLLVGASICFMCSKDRKGISDWRTKISGWASSCGNETGAHCSEQKMSVSSNNYKDDNKDSRTLSLQTFVWCFDSPCEGREHSPVQWAESWVSRTSLEILKWSLYTFRALEFCGPGIVFG